MSEKRFEISKDKYFIFDNTEDDFLDLEDVVNKLNALHEENERLKKELDFKRKKEYFLSEWSIANAKNIQLRQKIKELEKENKQLKKVNGQLQKDIEFKIEDLTYWKYKANKVLTELTKILSKYG